MKGLVIVGLLVLAIVTGALKFDFFAGPGSADASPEVREAAAIAAAARTTDAGAALASVYALIDVAARAGNAEGLALIRRQLPALVARVDAALPVARERVLALNLQTSVARNCRAAALRLVAQDQWIFRTFADDVARNASPRAIRRFSVRLNRLSRWWRRQIVACAAAADPAERADVERAMATF